MPREIIRLACRRRSDRINDGRWELHERADIPCDAREPPCVNECPDGELRALVHGDLLDAWPGYYWCGKCGHMVGVESCHFTGDRLAAPLTYDLRLLNAQLKTARGRARPLARPNLFVHMLGEAKH